MGCDNPRALSQRRGRPGGCNGSARGLWAPVTRGGAPKELAEALHRLPRAERDAVNRTVGELEVAAYERAFDRIGTAA
ncbi:hypothetical protein Mnod_8698 (plasmid) [Methylobacterium nodulans ORS 2060]|uniref:Uncharacterized protein n=1 Tax=Methylobacterium nodulans (strain LMG 21967 / CNCM I-2342 / ORS 2060) TaxID=460265 RepID=B8IWG9_METNO|nr:hypothetical protein Mnod_8698 [Methylobacterium nodulans ORS 2060]